jgi:hypothetical protein
VFTRPCLESVLGSQGLKAWRWWSQRVTSDTEYLLRLTERDPRVGAFQYRQRRSPAASTRPARAATGRVFVVLNNDTILPPSRSRAWSVI